MLDQALAEARVAPTRAAVLKRFEAFAAAALTDQRRRVTPELRQQVKALKREGQTPAQIAALTGLSTPTIRKVLLQ